jgi:hypothetical protein
LQDGSFTEIGNVDGEGVVSMSDRGNPDDVNGSQLVIATGVSYWVYDSLGLSIVADAGAVSDVTFQDGYILFTKTNTDKFGISDSIDARSINALDSAVTGANTDLLLGCEQLERRVWFFGTDSIQIYINSGAAAFPFQLVDGGTSNGFGLAGKDSKVVIDSNVYWCSRDGRIYVNSGYSPSRISHYGIENSIREYSTTEDCEASAWHENGHTFIAFSFHWHVASTLHWLKG